MVNICLIGCGRVGRRHLEAMLKVKHEVNIEVVEPNTESINSTKELLPDFNNYFLLQIHVHLYYYPCCYHNTLQVQCHHYRYN